MTDLRARLLAALISRQGEFVSGETLSTQIGVSRVSIKNHVDQLVSAGFEIEAVRNRGYCLSALPLSFQPDAFRYYFDGHLDVEQILTFDVIDSTNMELDRRLNRGEATPMLAITGSQTQGKGRRGNQWQSHSGQNLYLSMGFRPNLPISRIGQYTLWLGMQLAAEIRETLQLPVMVKWPNDLYLNGKKLAGILTEAKIDTDHVQHLIVGVGLNINADAEFFPAELKSKGTSLRMEFGAPLQFNEIAAGIARRVLQASVDYFESPKQDWIRENWEQCDFLQGMRVQARSAVGVVEGIAAGIDERGELQIRLDDSTLQTVHSGEVTMAFEK